MKQIPEEQEAWVHEMKRHWPQAGPAPSISLAESVARPSLVVASGWVLAAAAAVVVLLSIQPDTTPEPPADWPVFNPRRRAALDRIFASRPAPVSATDSNTSSPFSRTTRTRVRLPTPPNNWSTL
jgi:hypothetical protein